MLLLPFLTTHFQEDSSSKDEQQQSVELDFVCPLVVNRNFHAKARLQAFWTSMANAVEYTISYVA